MRRLLPALLATLVLATGASAAPRPPSHDLTVTGLSLRAQGSADAVDRPGRAEVHLGEPIHIALRVRNLGPAAAPATTAAVILIAVGLPMERLAADVPSLPANGEAKLEWTLTLHVVGSYRVEGSVDTALLERESDRRNDRITGWSLLVRP